MNEIYYGAGTNVIGPYHPDEFGARALARHTLERSGRQVYEIRASSYEEARLRLLRATCRAA